MATAGRKKSQKIPTALKKLRENPITNGLAENCSGRRNQKRNGRVKSRKEITAQKKGTAKNDSSAAEKTQPSKKNGSRDMVADRGSSYVWNDCSISYDASSKTYQIVNNSLEDILIYKDDTVIGGLKSGGKVFVDDTVTLQRKGSQERLRLSGKNRQMINGGKTK